MIDWVNLNAYFFQFLQFVMTHAQPIYDAWISKCILYTLQGSKFVGVAIDGATTMLGVHDGLVAKLKIDILRLFSIHYIVHREALAASYAFKKIK